MHLGLPKLNVPAAPPAPEPPREAPRAPDHAEARAREEAFERALESELRQKDMPDPRPIWVQFPTDPAFAAESAAIRTVEASAATSLFQPRQLATLIMPRVTDDGGVEEGVPVAPVEVAEAPPETVSVLVEPGLPQVQPAVGLGKDPVPLVEFPQVVVGQVRQMQKDNQPITQLDFEITPPHVGPVNLQIALQNGAVNVQLVALTAQAKQALESQTGHIQAILQSHNLNPGQVKVVTASHGRGGAGASGKGDQPGGFGMFHGGRRRGAASEDMAIEA